MTDAIIIKDLTVFYRVGVPEEERFEPQRLLITVEMALDFGGAAKRDDLGGTVDYDALTRKLLDFGRGRSWKLIETVAVQIAEMILADLGPQGVTVEVKKFVIPEARYVAVCVTRVRDQA